jgi:hypothetical protein
MLLTRGRILLEEEEKWWSSVLLRWGLGENWETRQIGNANRKNGNVKLPIHYTNNKIFGMIFGFYIFQHFGI